MSLQYYRGEPVEKRHRFEHIPLNYHGFLGKCLTFLRQKERTTMAQLADLLGCSRAQYSRMEHGQNQFKDEYLAKLSIYFGVAEEHLRMLRTFDQVLDFLDYERQPERAKHILKALLNAIDSTEELSSNEEIWLRNNITNAEIFPEERLATLTKLRDETIKRHLKIGHKMNALACKLQGEQPENRAARELFRQLEYDQQRVYSLQNILEKKMAEMVLKNER